MVGKINLKIGKEILATSSKFNGERCERCWKYFEKEYIDNDNICKECKKVIENN